MQVNAKKCEALVFSNVSKAVDLLARESGMFVVKAADAIGMKEGKQFEWRKQARYLGLHYGPDEPFSEQPELVVAGTKGCARAAEQAAAPIPSVPAPNAAEL
jgi:hypothetical protein